MLEDLRRRIRVARTWLVYRVDRVLEWPPIVQVLLVAVLTAMLVALFASLATALDATPHDASFTDELWWSLTHFADGGTMANDPPGRRVAGALVSGTGILVLSLLVAALTSKMADRIGEMRGGLLPVVERDHVLVLGYAPNTPLFVRELARSQQRAKVVVLATTDKAQVELSLRAVKSVAGQRLSTIVRTGDPRQELALVRVAADRARAIVVLPPAALSDEESVRWTLAVLLALHRVLPETWRGRVLVEARHDEARELLDLAVAPGIAGSGAVSTRVIATDRVVAQILAQSARHDALYFVLRHLLAFDGCEVYFEDVPADLVGRTFGLAHARVEGAILVGLMRAGRPLLAPRDPSLTLERDDRLVVIAEGRGRARFEGTLPPAPAVAAPKPAQPERVVILGHNATLPHLLAELGRILPRTSRIDVLTDHEVPDIVRMIASARDERPKGRAIEVAHRMRSAVALAREGSPELCAADAIVILGEEGVDDVNGDASALAMLLRLRKAVKKWLTDSPGERGARLVTEVRDPRSAMHVEPRPGDAVVSSDVTAMLLAQGVLDPDAFPIYDALLSGVTARVVLRDRHEYVPAEATFADVMAAARARGEIALGVHPDPRPHPSRTQLDRQRLEEGDASAGEEAWLNPPRSTVVPADDTTKIVVITPTDP
ncbi:MAG: hypothetical protein J0L92_08195 [Deltaproteobacteria bacterium]|nr:hypothetical protein [Deltaproteobacteria bacterium]